MIQLFEHVEFDHTIAARLFVRDGIEFGRVPSRHIPDRLKPVVDQSVGLVAHGRLHAAAAIMARHDDVLHIEHFHGVLQHAHRVEVTGHHEVRDVAVDEQFTRLSAQPMYRNFES